jgi:MoaA/NifB/PqqE/SkfB family radical SAM enzyme
MYFGRDGVVSACCYSRNAALGRYPEQTVEEIWESAAAAAMRAALRRNEMPRGCDLCADQLLAGNFKGLLAGQFDPNARPAPPVNLVTRIKSLFTPETPKQFPVQMEFELSNKCNLECAMCSGFFSSSIRANRENLPALPQNYGSDFVEQLLPFLPHLKQAKFLGGEPFLIDIYYDIWEKLIELNPHCAVSITTNGTVYTEKVKRVLEKLNCQIIVSLDSVVKPTYEVIRKNASMEKTLANFEAFCEFNRRRTANLSIAICPMQSNASEIPGLVDFASERGVRVFFNTVVFPKTHSLRAASEERQRDLVELYRGALREPNNDVEAANRTALEGFCHQLEFWISEREQPPVSEQSPLARRCSQLLATETYPRAYRTLLADLAMGKDDPYHDPLVLLDGDPIETLKTYYQSMWYLGALLQRERLLPGTNYDRTQEEIFLAYLTENVGPAQARKIYTEGRRFPKLGLELVGTLSAEQLIGLLDQHLAAPPPQAEALVEVHNIY